MKEATIRDILGAGSGGGIAYWAYTVFRGGQPAGEVAQVRPEIWLWVSLVLVVILGAAAAFLMVYFVAATNTKDRMRAVGFAVACGLCWEPVLAGVADRFTREFTDRETAQTLADVRSLEAPAATQAADVAAELVRNSAAVQNPVLKTEVREQTEKLVETISATSDVAVKTDALRTVGEAAAQARNPAVLAQTMKALEVIADNEPPNQALRAREALKAIDARVLSAR